jgi:hypothetical protein
VVFYLHGWVLKQGDELEQREVVEERTNCSLDLSSKKQTDCCELQARAGYGREAAAGREAVWGRDYDDLNCFSLLDLNSFLSLFFSTIVLIN